MRNLLFIIFACTLCYPLVTACQPQQRGLKVVAFDPSTKEKIQLYQDSRALLIGINKYQNVEQLNYAVADAESIKSLLIKKFDFPPENITTLLDSQATKKHIENAFASLLEGSTNDRVIVFFAGHGTQADLPGGGEMGYLIPVDGKTKTPGELFTSCISMDEIKRIANQMPAKHVLFLVDACYGGLSAITSRSLSPEAQLYLQKIARARSRQIITAGGRGEQVVEKAEWGHSAFTRAILEGLNKELADLDGNKLITASELASYLKPKVTASSDSRQTPQFKSFTDDEGDFVFVLSKPYEVTIASTPLGALIRINGVEKGNTPSILPLEVGEYEVELTHPQYNPSTQRISINNDTTLSIQLIERLFELVITSNPEGAQVFLNGVPQQGTTTLVTKVRSGSYIVELVKQGYQKWTTPVDVNANKTITAELKEIGVEEIPPTAKKKKEEQIPEIHGGSNTLYWLLGSTVLIGGGVVADILTDGKLDFFGLLTKEEPPTTTSLTDQHPRLPKTTQRK